MKKIFFFLAALTLSFTAQAAVVNAHPNGGEANVLSWFLSQTNAGDTLLLADGEYIQPYSLTFDKKGLVVMAAEDAKPVIYLNDAGGDASFKPTTTVTFDGITFDCKGLTKYPIVLPDGDAPGTYTFRNCEFKNYKKFAISNPWGEGHAFHLDSLIVDGCLFHDGGAAVYLPKYGAVEGKDPCDYVAITNTTIYNITEPEYIGVIQVSSNGERQGAYNETIIDHVTMYNFTAGGYGALGIRKSTNLKISNSIIANPTAGQYAFYLYGGTIDNTLYFNTTDDTDATHTACLNEDPKFVDAANGNFALDEGSPALTAGTDGKAIGDPRWNAPAVEVVTHTIEGEVLEKIDGRYLTLVAKDETHGDIELNIIGYDGLSESYSISGAIDGVNVEGTCTYTVDEEAGIETLVASVATDDATVKYEITLVYTIPTAQQYLIMMTEGIEAERQVFEWEDVDEEGNPVTVRIAAYSWHGANEEWEVNIEAGETIEGFYAMGTVANLATEQVVEISVLEEAPVIEEVMGQLSIYGLFTDGLNTYEVYLIGQLPVVEEEGTTKYITLENADIAPGMDIATDLEIWAEDEDENTIMIALTKGTTKMYGDYTAEELYVSYNWETATLLEETVGTYKLDGEVAVFEATVLCGADTLVLSISGTPWVNPATIVPVETVEMKFYEGTIGYKYGTTNIAGTNAEATLNIGIIEANESNMYDQEWSADDLSWETKLTIAGKEVAFIYGTVTIKKVGDDKVVTASLLGDDHVLYVITLTTGKELTTGLENLDTTVAPAKAIVNGQLVIIKNGVQYNAQGAVVK